MRSKKKLIAAASSVCFAAMRSLTAYASGDLAVVQVLVTAPATSPDA